MTDFKKRDEFLFQTLDEYKNGLIDLEDVAESDKLTNEEKVWFFGKIEQWRNEKLIAGEYSKEFASGFDQIDDTDSPIFTWGTKNSDEHLSPLEQSSLVIVAGKQGTGKTAWSFFFAEENAKLYKVDYVSLEMESAQILTRAGISYAGIKKSEWRDKSRISNIKKTKYKARKKELKQTKNLNLLGIDDLGEWTVESICTNILKSAPKLAIIDNLDLIQRSSTTQSSLDHHEHVTSYLLRFTSKNNIPIILLHHMKKSKEQGIDAIRGSGKITDNADIVLIIKRYVQEFEPDGEDFSEADIRKTLITQSKDRTFGDAGRPLEIFFDRGKFTDDIDGISNPFQK